MGAGRLGGDRSGLLTGHLPGWPILARGANFSIIGWGTSDGILYPT
jgi:hypothetical protein